MPTTLNILGGSTKHGGFVIYASINSNGNGKDVVYVGDTAKRPAIGQNIITIVNGAPAAIVDGLAVASKATKPPAELR